MNRLGATCTVEAYTVEAYTVEAYRVRIRLDRLIVAQGSIGREDLHQLRGALLGGDIGVVVGMDVEQAPTVPGRDLLMTGVGG